MLRFITLAEDVTIRNMNRRSPGKTIQSAPKRPAEAYHHGDLARAATAVGFDLLAERGPHGFTIAEMAKRIGVSTTALYRHFADKDALLAALAAESFRAFDAKLRAVKPASGFARLKAMTLAYLAFAAEHPSWYELMFGGRIEHTRYPDLAKASDSAFAALADTLADAEFDISPDDIDASAVKVWSQCHGLASLAASCALKLSARDLGDLAISSVAALVGRRGENEQRKR